MFPIKKNYKQHLICNLLSIILLPQLLRSNKKALSLLYWVSAKTFILYSLAINLYSVAISLAVCVTVCGVTFK